MTVHDIQKYYKLTGRLLLGCKGKVYDVSEKSEMYGKDGPYHPFIGKDASVALAKMKFDKEFMDTAQYHWSEDLEDKEMEVLDDWAKRFDKKYLIVAEIVDDKKLKKE